MFEYYHDFSTRGRRVAHGPAILCPRAARDTQHSARGVIVLVCPCTTFVALRFLFRHLPQIVGQRV
jgi:hypothetical protein